MASQFEPIGYDYASRNFNDRRKGNQQYGKGQKPPRGGNERPDAGGTKVPRKPKPKGPSSSMALKLK
jgi:hypothetical protein